MSDEDWIYRDSFNATPDKTESWRERLDPDGQWADEDVRADAYTGSRGRPMLVVTVRRSVLDHDFTPQELDAAREWEARISPEWWRLHWRTSVENWHWFTARIASRGYGPHQDDYGLEMYKRGLLAELQATALGPRINAEVAAIDCVFREATFEWSPTPLDGSPLVTDDWWWSRIPNKGWLASELRRREQAAAGWE